jgi:signal transduction histidine kinase/ligand-binding sensor domain-containing protein
VNWYDGDKFLQPEMHTRSGQIYVMNFLEDRKGSVWINCWYSGLYRYANGRFTNYLMDTTRLESQSNSTFDMVELPDGRYLVATDENVWISINRADTPVAFTIFDPTNPELKKQINSLAVTSKGDVLIGFDRGLALYRRTGNGWNYGGMLWPGIDVNKLSVRGDTCWIGSRQGLYCIPSVAKAASRKLQASSYKLQASSYKLQATSEKLNAGRDEKGQMMEPVHVFGTEDVETLFVDAHRNVWFSCGSEVVRLNSDFPHSAAQVYNTTNGLPSNVIRTIFADDEGIAWIGTDEGLSRLNKEYYHFYPLTEQFGSLSPEPDGRNYANIISINSDQRGRLWLGSYAGLFRMREDHVSEATTVGGASVGFVYTLLKDQAGQLWAATDAGIVRIGPEGPELRFTNKADCATLDRDGNIWFAARNATVLRLDQKGGLQTMQAELIDQRVSAIYRDGSGYLWLGYGLAGLKKFRVDGDRLVLVKEYSGVNGYANLRIRSLADDGRGHLLAGTRTNGLYVFDITGPPDPSNAGQATAEPPPAHVSTMQGLCGNWVKGIAVAPEGIYVATNNGLDLLDNSQYNNAVIRHIPFRNERVPSELNAVYVRLDTVWVGTAKGVLQYIPRRQEKNQKVPPVYLMKVTINDRVDSSIHPFTSAESLPALSYQHDNLAFDFAGLSFRDEENVRYSYRLEGLDKGWSPATERRYVNYSHLSPGKYTFLVRARNNDGVWSETPAALSFRINAPFWLQGWFIALCVLSLAAMLYALYRYRLQQALKIERLRTRISTDLHDDIGSTLSSISIISDMILREGSHGSPDGMVREIKENSLSLMDKMDDIVWSINPRNDALENLMVRVQRFAAQLFEAKGIDYEMEIESNIRKIKLSMEDRQHVYLIMKEAINNLVKYAGARKASIRAGMTGNQLRVQISDDGKGILPEEEQKGNGIPNMKSRAEAMKAALVIHSAASQGTTVELTLKIR